MSYSGNDKLVVRELTEPLLADGVRVWFDELETKLGRQFYLAYHAKLQPLVGEISWAKHLVVMARCKDDLEREFYIRMTKKFGWTKTVLIHQIECQSYQATLLGQTNFDRALTPKLRVQAKLAIKVEYALQNARKPIGVATYRTVRRLPRELKGQLPAPEVIAKLLEDQP